LAVKIKVYVGEKMNRKFLLAFIIIVVVLCKPVFANPIFEISTSSKVAEKGHNF